MPERARYVILGSGPAGTRAAETIRHCDREGRIVVVAEDPRPFYNRILLSKGFLENDSVSPAALTLRSAEAFAAQGVELWSGVRAVALDPVAREVALASAGPEGRGSRSLEPLVYERCLIATGARPLPLPVPGADLPGVQALRTLDDAIALRSAAAGARRAIIVGGGLIGMEVAVALTARGIDCTLLARERWLYGHVAPAPVGRALETVLASGGVELRLETTVAAIETAAGKNGAMDPLRVHAVDGRVFEADLVPVGVGVIPNLELLAGTGLAPAGSGVQVDARLRSAAPDVYAAGDVAAYEDPVVGARHRVEHWLHAQHQGRHAGRNMTGGDAPYGRVSTYDTELFGVPVTAAGSPELAREWVARGSFDAEEEGETAAYGLREGRIVAAFLVGRPAGARGRGEITRLIEAGAPIGEAG